jgi:transcriptional regulator with XRE-family HTH domain
MITNLQIKAARALLEISATKLAEISGISIATISKIERGMDSRNSTLATLRKSLEEEGVTFLSPNVHGVTLLGKKDG